jgi:hypothetical protein
VALTVEEKEETTSLSSPEQIMHSTNTLEHILIFLKGTINEPVFMNLVSLTKIFQPPLTNFKIWQHSVCFGN